ncbi:hypothetical protein FACS189447_02440 [Spirochaetia bacterium]|nr:hypothetical protein FACS189447_02440 [Spirochaetia bacterium]
MVVSPKIVIAGIGEISVDKDAKVAIANIWNAKNRAAILASSVSVNQDFTKWVSENGIAGVNVVLQPINGANAEQKEIREVDYDTLKANIMAASAKLTMADFASKDASLTTVASYTVSPNLVIFGIGNVSVNQITQEAIVSVWNADTRTSILANFANYVGVDQDFASWVSENSIYSVNVILKSVDGANADQKRITTAHYNEIRNAIMAVTPVLTMADYAGKDASLTSASAYAVEYAASYGTNIVNVVVGSNVALTINDYHAPANVYEPFVMTPDLKVAVNGKAVTVALKGDEWLLPLANVHQINRALKAAGASSISIATPNEPYKLVLSFKGTDWFHFKDGDVAGEKTSLYEGYLNNVQEYIPYVNGEELIEGVTIIKNAESENKYAIKYKKEILLDTDVVYHGSLENVYGVGLIRDEDGGWTSVVGAWNTFNIRGAGMNGGLLTKGNSDNTVKYFEHLDKAGLLPGNDISDIWTPYPIHNVVFNNDAFGADKNIMSNGTYDLIRIYKENGVENRLSIGYNSTANTVDGSGNVPSWPFDGRNGFDGDDRKDLSTGVFESNFKGTIPVALVEYLRANVVQSTTTFKNVNIVGVLSGVPIELNMTNVALVGNYSGKVIASIMKGEIDIVGNAPAQIINSSPSKTGYLKIREVPSTFGVKNFAVLDVSRVPSNQMANVGTNSFASPIHPSLILFRDKDSFKKIPTVLSGITNWAGTPLRDNYNVPYKAFMNQNVYREFKYANDENSIPTFPTSYRSTPVAGNTVPYLSWERWQFEADNNNDDPVFAWDNMEIGAKKWVNEAANNEFDVSHDGIFGTLPDIHPNGPSPLF